MIWFALLVFSRLAFRTYNRLPSRHRVLTYPVLQLSKYGSILFVFTPGTFGCLLVISQITAMWVNYIVYRLGGDTRIFPKEPFRLVFFVVMALVVVTSETVRAAAFHLWSPDIVALATITCWLVMRVLKAMLMRRLKPR